MALLEVRDVAVRFGGVQALQDASLDVDDGAIVGLIGPKRARAVAALRRFGLLDEWDRHVADLSFAKARFVELAAVAAERPKLMLLDEPTTGLDVGEVRALSDILAGIRADGTSMLVVAHDV